MKNKQIIATLALTLIAAVSSPAFGQCASCSAAPKAATAPAKTSAKQAVVVPVAQPPAIKKPWWKFFSRGDKAPLKAIPVAETSKPAPKAAPRPGGSHFKCEPGPQSNCACSGMGAPAPVCTGICRPDSCRCGVPVAPCRDTCKKGQCECPKRPPPAAHPCQCPGMQREAQRQGKAPVGALTGKDCGSGCGAAVGFRTRLAPNAAPVLSSFGLSPGFTHPEKP